MPSARSPAAPASRSSSAASVSPATTATTSRGREPRHVPAGFVAPRPEILDAFLACALDRRLELGDLVRSQAEARQPELRRNAVPLARLAQELREATHERPGRLVPVLPVRVG